MQSPFAEPSPFHPLFGCVPPYKFLWTGRESNLHLPPFSHATAFPFPSPVSPHVLAPPANVFNMLAAQEMVTNSPAYKELRSLQDNSLLAAAAEDRLANGTSCSPVTPPLTPVVQITPISHTDTVAVDRQLAAADASMSSATPPPRVSSRNRRPPAFIEGESTCPLCGLLLRASDLADHYQKELDSVTKGVKINATKKREIRISSRISEKKSHLQEQSRQNVLTRVRQNRKSRITKSGERCRKTNNPPSTSSAASQSSNQVTPSTSSASTAQPADAACPVCSEVLAGHTADQMTEHVECCLSKQSDAGSNEDASASDDEYETYTWCGQTRVRATSFLDSNELAASGFNTVQKQEEDETPLVVDDDMNVQQFGGVQYSEADIIPCASEEPSEAQAQSALRNAVISSSAEKASVGTSQKSQSKWAGGLSKEDSDQPLRCLICMDKYSTPLVSVQCWHVHCEECWLRTLGAKKLCPQCNMITSPADLRRIYL